ncbi:hypothetical protein HYX02_07925 [Candidatus Woesearchaeota archaeon]|nr:hypothetical protein [Candidatus Woesearchaeota archaeon]
MIKNKSGIILEALLRLIISVIVIVFVFNLGRNIAAAVLGTNLEENFHKFVNEMENLDVDSKQTLVFLKKDSSIIGFSQNAQDFRCYGCGSAQSMDIISYFKKPENEECGKSNDKNACICLCVKPLQVDKAKQPYEMKCERILCRSLRSNLDIIDNVELKSHLDKLEKRDNVDYSKLKSAKWVGGFLYEKHNRGDLVSNGLPQPVAYRFTVNLERKNIGDKTYIAVCPSSGCIESYKPSQQPQLQKTPPDVCRVMQDCTKSLGIRTPSQAFGIGRSQEYDSYCNIAANRPVTKYITKEDCEKVRECVNKIISLGQTQCLTPKGEWPELRFIS